MKVTSIIAAVFGAVFRVAVAVVVVFYIYKGAGICYDYGYRIFTEPAMTSGEGRAVTVSITSDMSALDIGKLLENRGLIRDAKLFVLQYYLSEYVKEVQPGEFELSTAMTVEDMMVVMAEKGEEEDGGTGGTGAGGTGSAGANGTGAGGEGADGTGAGSAGADGTGAGGAGEGGAGAE